MTIIGFQFDSLSAKKLSPAKGKIQISRNCTPTNVEEVTIGTGQKALKYSFKFTVGYEPKVAAIEFEGTITELADDKNVKEVMDSWKKNKGLPSKTLEKVMNGILARCQVEALIMSKELNIPSPVQMPRVKVSDSKKQANKK